MVDDTVEEWKPILGFEESYEISNCGYVRRKTATTRYPAGWVLKPEVTRSGYLSVSLWDRDRKHRPIHQLVAEAFIGPRLEAHQVNHIDGDKFNNRVTNLEYVTPKENIRHSIAIGLRWNFKGRPKLTEYQVKKIKALVGFVEYGFIAKGFNIHPNTVYRVANGICWDKIQ